ncbi:MAG: serine O-acetyltransferase EpsC [Candidatus Binatia bacterium]
MSAQHPSDLEDVITEVAASYGGGRLIDSLGTATLPSKRQVIEALNHLKAAMYLGYYATGSLDESKVRFAVGSHLYPAYEILVEQIRRAVGYVGFRTAGEPHPADWPTTVTLALLKHIPTIRTQLSKDVLAAFQGDPAANNVEEIIFSYPSIEAITVHRIAHELHTRGVPMLPRIMAEHAHSFAGIDIHPGAKIGESFFIDHGTGVVIGETCVIGDHVKIYQGVTLGALSVERSPGAGRGKKRHPTIEDSVTIYAGATILGGATVIGAGSVIGGNVWLVDSVPAGSHITFEDGPRR